jgi:hypothetical protein
MLYVLLHFTYSPEVGAVIVQAETLGASLSIEKVEVSVIP